MKNYRKRTGKRSIEDSDEFLGLTERIKFYVTENTTRAYTALGVVGAVIILTVLVSMLMEQSNRNVLATQARALKYYDVEAPAPGDEPMGPEQRLAKAKELFTEIAGEHSGSPYTPVAQYYKANVDMEMGELDAAIEQYRSLAKRSGADSVLASLANNRLAAALKMKGDYQGAMDVYKEMSEAGPLKDEGHFMLARMHETAGQTDQAVAQYAAVKDGFPGSPWYGEAERKVEELSPVQAGEEPAAEGEAAPAE